MSLFFKEVLDHYTEKLIRTNEDLKKLIRTVKENQEWDQFKEKHKLSLEESDSDVDYQSECSDSSYGELDDISSLSELSFEVSRTMDTSQNSNISALPSGSGTIQRLYSVSDDISQEGQSSIEEFNLDSSQDKSGDEAEREDEIEPTRKQTRQKHVFEQKYEFANANEFEEWFESRKDEWAKAVKHETNRGLVQNYRCAFAKRKKNYNCLAAMRAIYHSTSPKVFVEISIDGHDHDPSDEDGLPLLTPEIKDFIRAKMKETIVPSATAIRNDLLRKGLASEKLNLDIINNFKQAEKKRKGEDKIITVHDLQQYCDKKLIQEGLHDTYVMCFHLEESPQEIFVLWTTPKLLEKLQQQHLLQVDATHKLLWHNMPVQLFGYSDLQKHFHPAGVALTKYENAETYERLMRAISENNYKPLYVLGDGNPAISAGAKKVFEALLRIMCYFHMMKNVKDQTKSIENPEIVEQILTDIKLLKRAMNKDQFLRASTMMIQHWRQTYGDEIKVFADYFEAEWTRGHKCFWFDGAYHLITNNNGLEAYNNIIKSSFTFRQRLPLESFTKVVEDMLSVWSKGSKDDPSKPSIPLKTFDSAYKLRGQVLEKERFIRSYKDGYVFTSAKINGPISSNDIRNWYQSIAQNRFSNFEEYTENRHKFHMVSASPHIPDWYVCTCEAGSGKSACKHSVLIMEKLRLVVYPPETTSAPILPNRKRGRPRKSQGALTKD